VEEGTSVHARDFTRQTDIPQANCVTCHPAARGRGSGGLREPCRAWE
jgi:hypothetical protein